MGGVEREEMNNETRFFLNIIRNDEELFANCLEYLRITSIDSLAKEIWAYFRAKHGLGNSMDAKLYREFIRPVLDSIDWSAIASAIASQPKGTK
jgi:hypothetical protein